MNVYKDIQNRMNDGPVLHRAKFNGKHTLDKYDDSIKKGFIVSEEGYVENISTRKDLIILGGGYVGQAVYDISVWLDIPVTVIDNRPEFASKRLFPKAKRVICGEFATVLETEHFKPFSAWLLATSAHKFDTECLSYILKKDTFYIGMIGSKKKIAKCYSDILDMGFSEDDLKKVHAPVGLPIGGNTPREIAVAIAGEIISLSSKEKYITIPSDVLEKLATAPEGSVTAIIIKSTGSSPRKEGTRLVVYPDGKVFGTIGGGIMEARAIQYAKSLIKSGENSIQHFNLDSKAMVCGGQVDVFFEVTGEN